MASLEHSSYNNIQIVITIMCQNTTHYSTKTLQTNEKMLKIILLGRRLGQQQRFSKPECGAPHEKSANAP